MGLFIVLMDARTFSEGKIVSRRSWFYRVFHARVKYSRRQLPSFTAYPSLSGGASGAGDVASSLISPSLLVVLVGAKKTREKKISPLEIFHDRLKDSPSRAKAPSLVKQRSSL